jgi:hypothetical protein
MRYSNALEIAAMTLLWAVVLIWYDIAFNQQFFRPDVARVQALSLPQVNLWIQHVGCSGKAEEVMQALQALPWLSKPELKRAQGVPEADAAGQAKRPEGTHCDVGVLANVSQIERADFVEIDNVLRPLNVVPTTVEFGGIPHFALKARLANLTCEPCARVAMDALTPRKDPKFGVTFKWLDSRRVNIKEQTITAFVRFNNTVHIDEMTRALTQAGLPPLSLHVVLE